MGDTPKDYLRVRLDDPNLPEPLNAALFQLEDGDVVASSATADISRFLAKGLNRFQSLVLTKPKRTCAHVEHFLSINQTSTVIDGMV